MVIQNKALICALEVLIKSKYASNMYANNIIKNIYICVYWYVCILVRSLLLTKYKN